MQIREAWSYGERRLIFEVVGVEPFVAAVAAFAERWGYGAEEVSGSGAVVVHLSKAFDKRTYPHNLVITM